jgi:DNA-binding NarL/FixJ family response regulator
MTSLAERQHEEGVIRVALTHPMQAWVEALERLLESRWDIEVASAHTSLGWVRRAVETGQVDVLVAHVEPPGAETFAMLEDFQRAGLEPRVVVISEAADAAMLSRAIQLGVRGWVDPAAPMEHLISVLHGVARGETWMPPRLMGHVLESLLATAKAREEADEVLAVLSARETEILRCLAEGMSRRQIADAFALSPHTVRTHINNLLHKLDVHSTLAAVAVARRAGLARARD